MKIRILASALADLKTGKDFYDRQERGAGDYFQNSLFSDIESLVPHGGIHRKIFGYHRLLAQRFPYAVYYRMEREQLVTIHRILDCRRNPSTLRKELS